MPLHALMELKLDHSFFLKKKILIVPKAQKMLIKQHIEVWEAVILQLCQITVDVCIGYDL